LVLRCVLPKIVAEKPTTIAVNFLPHTPTDRQQLLAACGLTHIDDLFADIPFSGPDHWDTLPRHGLDELTLESTITQYARQNHGADKVCFLGAGAYARYVPAVVNHIASRSEFYTAYTPYQPEIAQGTLQVIYEFQTMIAELTGLPVANASVYDAANAVTEAALMALRITRRPDVLVASGVHPHATDALACYMQPLDGLTLHRSQAGGNVQALLAELTPTTACLIVQTPDYVGTLWPMEVLAEACQANGTLLVVSADPVSLGLLTPPGQLSNGMGADIVVGDLQPLGNGLSFGGPYAGYMACKAAYLRQLPGRLVSRTTDASGQTAYCLTLQTREQHIRRQKATSNICTNQALNVLKATVMLTLLGPTGLKQLASISVKRAHALARRLAALPGIQVWHANESATFFNEFVVTLPIPVNAVLAALEDQGILGGLPVSGCVAGYTVPPNSLLIATTELTPPLAIDRYVSTVAACLDKGLNPSPELEGAMAHA
jgi:glycine dehydrogenase subunit 1